MTETTFSLAGRRVYVAGHLGMVGSACVRRLQREACEILVADRTRLDLTRQADVDDFMAQQRPDVVVVAAAKVGGIMANTAAPAEFLYDNLMIEANLIHAAHRQGARKLLFLGSASVYPAEAPQPIAEAALLTGPLDPVNEAYAIAKIAGIKLCQAYRRQYGCDFISALPCNLYGTNDNYHPETSHVIPGMLRRFHEARQRGAASVTCWGSGRARREFLHVDDLAEACVFLLQHHADAQPVNVGTGGDISILELAEAVRLVTGFSGEIVWDRAKPDGTLLKRMDTGLINKMGWFPRIPFDQGLTQTYAWFRDNADLVRI